MNIALLIPCYNAEPYLKDLFDNITLLPFDEIIFYNDASTDNSLNILKASGYKYLTSDINNGPAYARNQLIKASTCTYIHFHDADDLIDPLYLTKIKNDIAGNYDAILGDANWVDTNGNTIIEWKYKNISYQQEGHAYLLRNPVGGINGLYKKEALLELGGFDVDLKVWEDADLNLRFAINKKIHFTETVLATSTRHNTSASSNDHKIRKYKCLFLSKYLYEKDSIFRCELIKQVNQLFHDIVYTKDWILYNEVLNLSRKLNIKIPLTTNNAHSFFKLILGPKLFTRLKYFVLKKFIFKT